MISTGVTPIASDSAGRDRPKIAQQPARTVEQRLVAAAEEAVEERRDAGADGGNRPRRRHAADRLVLEPGGDSCAELGQQGHEIAERVVPGARNCQVEPRRAEMRPQRLERRILPVRAGGGDDHERDAKVPTYDRAENRSVEVGSRSQPWIDEGRVRCGRSAERVTEHADVVEGELAGEAAVPIEDREPVED